jgi:hypothetical protein
MEFIDHAVEWCRGEIFEGKMILLWGIVVLVVSLAFWKFGSTPFAKAMFIPLMVVGGLSIASGASMHFVNKSRIVQYRAEFKMDAAAFVQSEKKRTEAFIKWYPYTMFSFSALIVVGLGIYLFLPTPGGRASGLALVLLGMSILFVDHFSEERADIYHQKIAEQLNR